METLMTIENEDTLQRQRLAKELVAAAERGEITNITDLNPKDTSIEVVQQIRAILKMQGILPHTHEPNQL